MAKKDPPIYVEPHKSGGFAVEREHAKRASAIEPTQKEAIAKAKELSPDSPVHIARVRNVEPGPDKYRKE